MVEGQPSESVVLLFSRDTTGERRQGIDVSHLYVVLKRRSGRTETAFLAFRPVSLTDTEQAFLKAGRSGRKVVLGILRAVFMIEADGTMGKSLPGLSGLAEFGGGHIGVLFKNKIEGRFRVEAYLLGNGQDCVVFLCRSDQSFLGFFHAVSIDEVNEVLIQSFIDDSGKMLRRD